MVATDATARGATPSSSPSLEQYFDGRSLHTLRSAVAAHASAAGLGRQRVYDVTAAAHELAANTVRHGPGHGLLLLWVAEAFLYCQVSDDGTGARGNGQGPADPTPWQANPGHGLWLIGQVADELTIDRHRHRGLRHHSWAPRPGQGVAIRLAAADLSRSC
jgi:anti-sigma regulatory factor (Ser/Thr protein kinase)